MPRCIDPTDAWDVAAVAWAAVFERIPATAHEADAEPLLEIVRPLAGDVAAAADELDRRERKARK